MTLNTIHNVDCREGLLLLDDNSIDCCISSPPYWGLRDYGVEGSLWDGDPDCEHEFDRERIKKLNLQAGNPEFKRDWRVQASTDESSNGQFCVKCGAWKGCLGLEPTFDLYVKHLAGIYDLVKQKLKPTGTCWINLGDTYSGSGKGAGFKGECKERYVPDKRPAIQDTLPPKCLCMIPQRFAIEMIDRGWILRNVIVWHKRNCMPSSARDRFTVDFEYVYFFVKSKKYWFDQDAVRDTTRNRRCVWTINTHPNPEAHFASYPPKLVRPMILSGCPQYICEKCGKPRERIIDNSKRINTRPGKNTGNMKSGKKIDPNNELHNSDLSKYRQKIVYETLGWSDCGCNAGFEPGIVCDPFAGTGTTLLEAWKQGRNYIGFEISKEYCDMIEKRLKETNNRRLDEWMS